jgi:hypothetical protein
MVHPLKQRIVRLTDHELDNLESVLGAVLHETEQRVSMLMANQPDDDDDHEWSDTHAAANLRIMVLSKALGVEPVKN